MELVFLKLLAQECGDYVPTFLLKSQRLKDFEGDSADESFCAMLSALNSYFPLNDFVEKSVYLVADGASVNFCVKSGALKCMAELRDWDLPIIHCLNHSLELTMKDSYMSDISFEKAQEMLGTSHRLFRNSSKT